jgi:GTP cyclohydrolase FolE2
MTFEFELCCLRLVGAGVCPCMPECQQDSISEQNLLMELGKLDRINRNTISSLTGSQRCIYTVVQSNTLIVVTFAVFEATMQSSQLSDSTSITWDCSNENVAS